MEISWKTFITIIQRMWDIKQNKIAEYLHVDPATISRLAKGKQLRFSCNINDIYRNLFDPNTPGIPAHSKNPDELLRDMKAVIEEVGLSDATKDLDNNNYEKYVIGLLKLFRNNEPPLSTQEKISPNNVTDGKAKSILAPIEEPSVSMLDEFIKDYAIKKFIDSNPLDSLTSFRVRDAVAFIGRIRLKHEQKNSSDESEDVYKKIILFADILEKYLKFIAINSSNPLSFTKWNYINFPKYEPTDCNIDILRKEFDIYLRRLRKIYKSIEEEHKRKLKEYEKEWRSSRESTDNVDTGSLSNAIIHHLNSNQNSDV